MLVATNPMLLLPNVRGCKMQQQQQHRRPHHHRVVSQSSRFKFDQGEEAHAHTHKPEQARLHPSSSEQKLTTRHPSLQRCFPLVVCNYYANRDGARAAFSDLWPSKGPRHTFPKQTHIHTHRPSGGGEGLLFLHVLSGGSPFQRPG